MARKIEQMARDPAFGTLIADATNEFVNVTVPGETQNNLAAHNYTYMWRQNKESPAQSLTYLNDTVRGQFGEDPYFMKNVSIWN